MVDKSRIRRKRRKEGTVIDGEEEMEKDWK